MKRTTLVSLALLAGSVASVALTTVVLAAWTATTATGGVSGARAATLPAGNTPTAANAGGASVTVSWTATTLPDGTGVAAYAVRAYDATSGAPRAIGPGCDAVITTTCTETSAPDGRWQYSIEPRQGLWVGAESARSNTVVVDTTPPTVAITFPASSGAYNNAGWNAGCTTTICGTAADTTSGVASVAISIRDTNGNYWNGTAFASPTEVLLPATGTTSWSLAFPASNFTADGTHVVRAVATDQATNTASRTTSFTLDNAAPTVAITFPASGGLYNATAWNAGCSSAICGTANNTGGSRIASVSVSVQAPSGNYWNGTAFSSNTEVLLPASGTANWSFAFPSSNFSATGTYITRAVAADQAGNTAATTAGFTIDISAPTVNIAFPAQGGNYNNAAWDAGCGGGLHGICGTADGTGSGVASVAISIHNGTGQYWNGSGFNSATEVFLPATGTTTWSLVFRATNFPAGGSYTVRAVATDAAGNTAATATTFTITRP